MPDDQQQFPELAAMFGMPQQEAPQAQAPTPVTPEVAPDPYSQNQAQMAQAIQAISQLLKPSSNESQMKKAIAYTPQQRAHDMMMSHFGITKDTSPDMQFDNQVATEQGGNPRVGDTVTLPGTTETKVNYKKAIPMVLAELIASAGHNYQTPDSRYNQRALDQYHAETSPATHQMLYEGQNNRVMAGDLMKGVIATMKNQSDNRLRDRQEQDSDNRGRKTDADIGLINARSNAIPAVTAWKQSQTALNNARLTELVVKTANLADSQGLTGETYEVKKIWDGMKALNPDTPYAAALGAYQTLRPKSQTNHTQVVMNGDGKTLSLVNKDTGEIKQLDPSKNGPQITQPFQQIPPEVQKLLGTQPPPPGTGPLPQGQLPPGMPPPPKGPTPQVTQNMGKLSYDSAGKPMLPPSPVILGKDPMINPKVSGAMKVYQNVDNMKSLLAQIPDSEIGTLSGRLSKFMSTNTADGDPIVAKFLSEAGVLSMNHNSITGTRSAKFIEDLQRDMSRLGTTRKTIIGILDNYRDTAENTLKASPATEGAFRNLYGNTKPEEVLRLYYPKLYEQHQAMQAAKIDAALSAVKKAKEIK